MNNELLKLFDIKDDVVETFTVDHKESNYEIDIGKKAKNEKRKLYYHY